jgi:competence ComEA-like helix-hairpin-helix protein
MSSDWTGGPAKWAAVGALGCASVFGIAWTVMNRPAAPRAVVTPAPRDSPLTPPSAEVPPPPDSGAAPAVSAPAPAPAHKPAAGAKPTHMVNLNTAGQAELELLPGIGPALASRILEERRRLGRFSSIDQLDDVKGIGPKLMAKLRPLVRIE